MYQMFYGASVFNQTLVDWQTSKVENTGSLFYEAAVFNGDVNNCVTSSVNTMVWYGMVEVCEGAPVAVSGWVLTDRHDVRPCAASSLLRETVSVSNIIGGHGNTMEFIAYYLTYLLLLLLLCSHHTT